MVGGSRPPSHSWESKTVQRGWTRPHSTEALHLNSAPWAAQGGLLATHQPDEAHTAMASVPLSDKGPGGCRERLVTAASGFRDHSQAPEEQGPPRGGVPGGMSSHSCPEDLVS